MRSDKDGIIPFGNIIHAVHGDLHFPVEHIHDFAMCMKMCRIRGIVVSIDIQGRVFLKFVHAISASLFKTGNPTKMKIIQRLSFYS